MAEPKYRFVSEESEEASPVQPVGARMHIDPDGWVCLQVKSCRNNWITIAYAKSSGEVRKVHNTIASAIT